MDSPDLPDTAWRTSSHSANGGNCVQVAMAACPNDDSRHMIAVRDSKDRTGPVLVFALDQWQAFTAGVRDREFGLG